MPSAGALRPRSSSPPTLPPGARGESFRAPPGVYLISVVALQGFDIARFGAPKGNPKRDALSQALAVVVGLRVWRQHVKRDAPASVCVQTTSEPWQFCGSTLL
eukprot:11249265-Alexandrium_andersonii.AAC.1